MWNVCYVSQLLYRTLTHCHVSVSSTFVAGLKLYYRKIERQNSRCTSSAFSVVVLPAASKSEIHSTASWQLSSHVGRKLTCHGTTSDENRITLNLKSNVNIYETCYPLPFTIPLVMLNPENMVSVERQYCSIEGVIRMLSWKKLGAITSLLLPHFQSLKG